MKSRIQDPDPYQNVWINNTGGRDDLIPDISRYVPLPGSSRGDLLSASFSRSRSSENKHQDRK